MKLKLIMRTAARHSYRDGTLSEEHYQLVMDTIRHPIRECKDGTICNIMEKIESHVTAAMGKQGLSINWTAILQWLKDNWLVIVKLILALLPLFLI